MKVDDLRDFVLDVTGGHCAYCGRQLQRADWHVDHIIPRKHGGTSKRTNIFPSCIRCNTKKQDMTPDELRHYLRWQTYHKLHTAAESVLELCNFLDCKTSEHLAQHALDAVNIVENAPITFYFERIEA